MQGNKYNFNENVLTNPTPEFVYYLGWMWGDGHCYHRKGSFTQRLEIQKEDGLNICSFFESFCYPSKLTRQRDGRKPVICITLYDRTLGEFLKENDYEIKSSTSPEKILSFIPVHLHQFWFRGFFEADGSASFKEQSIKGYMLSKISFYASINQNWEFLYNFLLFYNIKPKTIKRIRKCGSSSEVYFCKQSEVSSFIELVYSSKPEMKLNRKNEIILKMKSYINRNCVYD